VKSNLEKVIAIAIVVCAAVVYVAWRHDLFDAPRSSEPSSEQSGVSKTSATAPPTLESAPLERASQADRQVVTDARVDPPVTTPTEPASATLIVRCIGKPGGRPLEGIRVYVSKLMGRNAVTDVDAQKGGIGSSPITASEGEVELALPAGFAFYVHASSAANKAGTVESRVPKMQSGERRELVLELPIGEDIRFHGIVTAQDDASPIGGAKVRVMHTTGYETSTGVDGVPEQRDVVLAETSTGIDGRFTLALSSWLHPFLRIDATGFGPALVAPTSFHDTEETAQKIELARGATIDATVLDPAGAPIAGATILASTTGHAVLEQNGTMNFGSASETLILWSATTAANGRCTLTDLAPSVSIRIVVQKDKRFQRSDVTFEPGEVRAMEFRIGSGCAIHGILLDDQGKPIERYAVWCVRARYAQPRYLNDEQDSSTVEARSVTHHDGTFAFDRVSSGRYWLGPAPPSSLHPAPAADAPAPFATVVDVPVDAQTLNVELRVARGLFIRGRVVRANGEKAREATIIGRSAQPETQLMTRLLHRDEFVLGPMMLGTFEVRAYGSIEDTPSDPVTAKAGDNDVLLQLKAAGSITGKVVDSLTGQGCSAEIACIPTGDTEASAEVTSSIQGDGSFEITGLTLGRYDLSARTDDGRTSRARDVAVTSSTAVAGIVLTLEPGAKVRIGYEGTAASSWFDIRCNGQRVAHSGMPKGKTSVQVVPKGKVTIELHHPNETKSSVRELDVAAGEEKDVVFKDDG
jgi:protocatechuate 3,4-dioxygenase beta subunit